VWALRVWELFTGRWASIREGVGSTGRERGFHGKGLDLLLLCVCVCLPGPYGVAGELAPLPGPGLDVPVDADGDGSSTYGDRYAFNYWLGLGGSLARALSAAEIGKNGVIDLSKFFHSSDAVLAAQSGVLEAEAKGESAAEGGGAGAQGGSCTTTSASLLPPFGLASMPPKSIFSSFEPRFRYPTGAGMDRLQGLWCSRGRPTDEDGVKGVVLLILSQVPPMGNDGRIPLVSPGITETLGFGAEGIVVRETPPSETCFGGAPLSIHAMSTWPTELHTLICRTPRHVAGSCTNACAEVDHTSNHGPGEPLITEPFAIDVVRTGMPPSFGTPKDVIFSDLVQGARIRRATTPTPCTPMGPTAPTVTTLRTFGTDVVMIWGLALGDFNGSGEFAVYFVAEASGQRDVRKLRTNFTDVLFCDLPNGNMARSIEFDPISGDLFVSEDRALSQTGGPEARIWRIDETGAYREFGQRFNKPNGIAFHPSGVMLVAEEACQADTGDVLAVGGWRNLFKRGDANGSGVVDISDPIFISNWLSQGGPVPPCLDGADANDDSQVLASDTNLILEYLFSGGPPPKDPGPNTCGRDPTADLLDCTKSLGAGCAIE
jgi:hypothetical protein